MNNLNLSKIQNILAISQSWEPNCRYYLINSLWVMACCEFENQFRTLVENYVTNAIAGNFENTHINILLIGFYGDSKSFNFKDILDIRTRITADPNFNFKLENFINGFQGISMKSMEKMLISLGINITIELKNHLRNIDAVYSTRIAIVHTNEGDGQKTTKDIQDAISVLQIAYTSLYDILYGLTNCND